MMGVVGPAAHEQESVGVQVSLVPRIEKAVRSDRDAGGVVLAGHLVAPHADPPGGARRDGVTESVEDPQVNRRDGPPRRRQSRPHYRIGAGERRPVIGRPEDRDRGTGLGGPVGIHDPDVRPQSLRGLTGLADDQRARVPFDKPGELLSAETVIQRHERHTRASGGFSAP